jgi:uncharacterized protein
MDTIKIVEETKIFLKDQLKNAEPGHDWWHVLRVWKMAKKIAAHYAVNPVLLDLGALLHDIADAKFHGGDENAGPVLASKFLDGVGLEGEIKEKVLEIIQCISFKNKDEYQPGFIEFKIIQDADRLDAMGAIGIARAFGYGGYRKRAMFDPDVPPLNGFSKVTYKKGLSPTINHFYEKLLTLKDLMNTPEAEELAQQRHGFMQAYLDRFFLEWDQMA